MTVGTDYEPVLLTHPGRTSPVTLDEYQAEGGYAGWVSEGYPLQRWAPAETTPTSVPVGA